MTKEELIKLLGKKGVNEVIKGEWFHSDDYKRKYEKHEVVYTIDLIRNILDLRNYNNQEICAYNIKLENLTEQKLDEILSQFTKIKTALYQIEKITEELK